jgi:SAM-dependent methyltransferase
MSMAYQVGGYTFPFSEEYYRALTEVRPLAKVATLPVYEGAVLDVHASKMDDITFFQFLVKFYEAALLLDALRSAGQPGRIRSMLDIGSGPALQPRVMKLAGYVDTVEAIDIYDASRRCSDSLLMRHARKLQVLYPLYRIQKLIPEAIRKRVSLFGKLDDKWPLGVEDFGHYPDEQPYARWFRSGPTLDAYHVGEVFAHRGRYDLVTSFMALEYLDFEKLAAKVADLLEPGGLFGFLVSYWWYPINNTLLYGRFPYLLQQLASDEVMAYYKAEHPELPTEGIARRLYHSDPLHPTIADYERIGYRQGLVPVKALRLHPNHKTNLRAIMGPLAIDTLPGWNLETVLTRARRIKTDLCLMDLMTSHVLMLFERR